MTKRVESLRAPCLDASSTLATSTSKRAILSLFSRFGGSVVQPVAFRVTYLWSVDVCFANLCFQQMAIFENIFSDIHPQNQQSSIASTALRSPLNCGGRSTLRYWSFVVLVSAARSFNRWRCVRGLLEGIRGYQRNNPSISFFKKAFSASCSHTA